MNLIDLGDKIVAREVINDVLTSVAVVHYEIDSNSKTVTVGESHFMPHLNAYQVADEMIQLLVSSHLEDDWSLVTTPKLCHFGHSLIVQSIDAGNNYFDFVGEAAIEDVPTQEMRLRLQEIDEELSN